MRFSELSPIDPRSRSLEQDIQTTAGGLRIDPQCLSVIRGVINWRLLLANPKPDNHQEVREYIRLVAGAANVSPLVSRALRDDCSKIRAVAEDMVVDIQSGALSAEWLVTAPSNSVRRVYPGISNPQIKVLQVLVKHRLRLDRLELSQAAKMLPFPLDEGSYLWRFIAGGSETPQHALRHIVASTPFLVTMRNLFEGLAADSQNFLELVLANTPRHTDEAVTQQTLQAIGAMVNTSKDLYGAHLGAHKQRLVWLTVPNLPHFDSQHISLGERRDLANALFGWLFFGDRSPGVLWRTKLPGERERQALKWRKEIAAITAELGEVRAKRQKSEAGTVADGAREDRIARLLKRLRNRESRLDAIEDQRDGIIPIGKQLEVFEKHNQKLKEFRADIKQALDKGCRPVLCFFSLRDVRGVTPWLELFDDAHYPRKMAVGSSENDPAAVLKRCSYVLPPEFASILRRCSESSERGYCRRQLRRFEVDTSYINPSVTALLSGVIPSRVAPELGELLSMVVRDGLVTGVASQSCLSGLAQREIGRRALRAADYFSFVCERATHISPDTMRRMLECMHSLGGADISPAVIDLCEARFGLSRALFEGYHEYAKRYRPERFGAPGGLFSDTTSLDSFLSLGLDAVGMAPELRELEQALAESQVVAVVDSTGYYPQFQSGINLGAVMTDEVWGEYVSPTARLVRSLALRVMSGEVLAPLRNSSVLVPRAPDPKEHVQQMLLRMLLGLEGVRGDNQGEANSVVAEIARYNEKAIVVLDATQVKNLQDYSQLLETLKSFQVKTILCTRQKFPVVRSVFIDPFSRETLADRVLGDGPLIRKKLGLTESLESDVVRLAVEQVKNSGPHQADPLHLTLQVIRLAAIRAKTLGEQSIVRPDLVDAASKVFNLSSPEQMLRHIQGVEAFRREAKRVAFGQDKAIDRLAGLMRRHMLQLRPDRSPLVVLLAGPTGTGKTLLAELLAKNLNLPLELIEGSQYTSYHQISRLVGSPADFRGPDEGKLFKFVYENPSGVVFIDEFEKMDQSFLPYLMNFLDRGRLESGDGKVTERASLTIVLASNAGADSLRPSMDEREIREIMSRALSQGRGDSMQWLVARMQILGVLGLNLESFKGALKKNLRDIQYLKGVWSANLELADIDDSACRLLFESTKDVCRFDTGGASRRGSIGFDRASGDGVPAESDQFIDMRYVEKSVTALVGDSLDELVQEQYETGRHADRTRVYKFRLVGDERAGLIKALLVDS